MYYLIKDWKIFWNSELPLSCQWYETIEKNFTKIELEKLNSWYLYINWKIIQWPDIEKFKNLKTENRKKEIILELWKLKQEKDWLILLELDKKEVENKIEELKKEYNNL
jgi:hypothetical protein